MLAAFILIELQIHLSRLPCLRQVATANDEQHIYKDLLFLPLSKIFYFCSQQLCQRLPIVCVVQCQL
jgi:hypothetical protein